MCKHETFPMRHFSEIYETYFELIFPKFFVPLQQITKSNE